MQFQNLRDLQSIHADSVVHKIVILEYISCEEISRALEFEINRNINGNRDGSRKKKRSQVYFLSY